MVATNNNNNNSNIGQTGIINNNNSSNNMESNNNNNNTTTRRASDNRRSNKPIMEKRRRARINNCLNELKTLILDAMKKDPARHSKLEKADILEMTVKHLQNLQRQQAAMSAATDPSVLNKFRAGFSECAVEVGRFPGLDPLIKRRLLQHLANCLNQNSQKGELPQSQQQQQSVQVHILPSPNNSNSNDHQQQQVVPQSNGIILSNGNGTGVQLVPTRLPNGDIALVLPTASGTSVIQQQMISALPLLVPIPQRTSSTASSGSCSSSYTGSPSHSPEPLDSMYHQPKPLSLVMRKSAPPVEEKPWRPW